jgi:uncharacterized integral membrane protein
VSPSEAEGDVMKLKFWIWSIVLVLVLVLARRNLDSVPLLQRFSEAQQQVEIDHHEKTCDKN